MTCAEFVASNLGIFDETLGQFQAVTVATKSNSVDGTAGILLAKSAASNPAIFDET